MERRRKIEIITLERERVIRRSAAFRCPVCLRDSEPLTVRQAGALLQVATRSIYRWLAQGKAHGFRTPGGGHRVCRESLMVTGSTASPARVVELCEVKR